jgi:ketosteroid isomerase-like protein
MSEESMEVVRRFYAAVVAADIERAVELCDAEIDVEDPDLPGGGTFHGREGMESYLIQFLEPWEHLSIEMEGLQAAGDRVVALTHLRARGKESQLETELRDAHVWTVKEGRLIAVRTYLDRAEALRAAGLV